jgi:hypothetical protein
MNADDQLALTHGGGSSTAPGVAQPVGRLGIAGVEAHILEPYEDDLKGVNQQPAWVLIAPTASPGRATTVIDGGISPPNCFPSE